MSEISAIKNTPDISFIDGKTVDDVQREMIADFEDYMTRIDGRPVTLGRASVHRAIINAAAFRSIWPCSTSTAPVSKIF